MHAHGYDPAAPHADPNGRKDIADDMADGAARVRPSMLGKHDKTAHAYTNFNSLLAAV